MARKKKINEDEMTPEEIAAADAEAAEAEKEAENETPEKAEEVAVPSDSVAETIEVPLTAEAAETPAEDEDAPESPEDTEAPEDGAEPLPEGDTFPRAYVEKLRRESAEYRVKAQRVDEIGARLHEALVAADGRLASPSDLPYDAALLDDPAALEKAIADLLAAKPHLASRKPRGNIGMGAKKSTDEGASLGSILRARA